MKKPAAEDRGGLCHRPARKAGSVRLAAQESRNLQMVVFAVADRRGAAMRVELALGRARSRLRSRAAHVFGMRSAGGGSLRHGGGLTQLGGGGSLRRQLLLLLAAEAD